MLMFMFPLTLLRSHAFSGIILLDKSKISSYGCAEKNVSQKPLILQRFCFKGAGAQFNVMSMVKGQGGVSFKTYSLPCNVPCYLMVGHET